MIKRIIDNPYFSAQQFLGLGGIALSGIILAQLATFSNLPKDADATPAVSENEAQIVTSTLHHTQKASVFHSFFHTKLQAFTKLLTISEKKSKVFYKDNTGIATAYGWNPTQNSWELNEIMANSMGFNKKEKDIIKSISNNNRVQSVPKELSHVVLSDTQLRHSANTFLNIYEQEFLKVLKMKADEKKENYPSLVADYYKLPVNQQVVLIHMTYKLGLTRLQEYTKFFNELIPFMKHPTDSGLERVSNEFEYSYKTRQGNYLHDTKTEQTHNVFFSECSVKSVVGVKTPLMSDCQTFVKNNIAPEPHYKAPILAAHQNQGYILTKLSVKDRMHMMRDEKYKLVLTENTRHLKNKHDI